MVDEENIPLNLIRGAYVRFNPALKGEMLQRISPDLIEMYAAQRRAAIHTLLDRLSCPVVNPPSAGYSNGSKPFQMNLLGRFGLSSPQWIVSNDPDKIKGFNALFPEGTIVKSCSGLRSEVRALDDVLLQRISCGSSPVIVQQRINGDDVRVHTVNGKTFGTRISGTDYVDYRFSKNERRYQECSVPREIAAACHHFAKKEGLLLAGFDFKIASDGKWWCLECNPAPTFLPYEMSTGQAISQSILDQFVAAAAVQ